MGGLVSKLKEDVRDLETEGPHMHPLLIPQVARTIFSSLGKKDLLSIRRVCKEWHALGTETYKNRKDIVHHVFLYHDEVAFQVFMDVMALSPRIPVVRLIIHVHPLSFPPADLLQFLSFIAPSVKSLGMGFHTFNSSDEQMRMNALGELLYKLKTLDPTNLVMPELEFLDVWRGRWTGVQDYAEPAIRVTHRIVAGAQGLKSFRCGFPLVQTLLLSLPRGLQRLELLGPFEEEIEEYNPYAVLMNAGFQLTDLRDSRTDEDGLFEFICLQKYSLTRMFVGKLEELYGQFRRGSFPQLKFVTSLECIVNCNCTFQFLKAFPNLSELIINVSAFESSTASKMVEIASDLSSLPQRPGLRRFHIYYDFSWKDEPEHELHQLIVFGVFGHCFPNLTHLSIPMNNSARWMTDVFTQFQKLESLYLDVLYEETPPREWDALLSGIPETVCDVMRGAGNYDDAVVVGDVSRFPAGLNNLKQLKTLKVRDKKHRFEFMFTDLIVHRVFSRMASLKEICFVEENNIPESCLPFVEPLKAMGIDLYRMKREIDNDLDI